MQHGYLSQCLQGAAIPAPNNFLSLTRHNLVMSPCPCYFSMPLVFPRCADMRYFYKCHAFGFPVGGSLCGSAALACSDPPPGASNIPCLRPLPHPSSLSALKVLNHCFIPREIFHTLKEAKTLIEKWQMEYNTFRPHSSLNYRSPAPEAYLN